MTTVGKPISTRTMRPRRTSVGSAGSPATCPRSLDSLLMPELCGNAQETTNASKGDTRSEGHHVAQASRHCGERIRLFVSLCPYDLSPESRLVLLQDAQVHSHKHSGPAGFFSGRLIDDFFLHPYS